MISSAVIHFNQTLIRSAYACGRDIYFPFLHYAYAASMTAELAVEAVRNACLNVKETRGILLHTYEDAKEARRAIFEYIESWYNRKRLHSAIDYMTPQQKEDEGFKKAA